MYKSEDFLFRKVMLDGGNAMDSAIATMYCNTVVNSQSMGIGLYFTPFRDPSQFNPFVTPQCHIRI